jgi:hypothetical protein
LIFDVFTIVVVPFGRREQKSSEASNNGYQDSIPIGSDVFMMLVHHGLLLWRNSHGRERRKSATTEGQKMTQLYNIFIQ